MKKNSLLICLLAVCLLGACAGRAAQTDAAAPTPETATQTAQQALDAADAAMARGDAALALESYRTAQTLDPADLGALRGEIRALSELGDTAVLIAAYESLRASDDFTEEETLALADLYLQTGAPAKARDLLEIAQCLAPTSEKAQRLEGITVPVAGENAANQAALAPLLEALAANDAEGAADALLSPGLFDALCSRVPDAPRRYSAESAAGDVRLAVLRGAQGEARLEAWLLGAHGRVTALRLAGDVLFLAEAAAPDGAYEGEFHTQRYEAAAGLVTRDAGVFRDGAATGAFTTQLCELGEATPLAELWAGRAALEFTTYSGELDGAGRATAQSVDGADARHLVYALSEDGSRYVYLLLREGEDAASCRFTPERLGLQPLPLW